MNNRNRLDDTARSLAKARREVFSALLNAAILADARREDDPLAEVIADLIDSAFLRMRVERVGAEALLAELEEEMKKR